MTESKQQLNRIECTRCGEPITGWCETHRYGFWNDDTQNYRNSPRIENHYCKDCWSDDFGRENGAHYHPGSADELWTILDTANGGLAATLTWWSRRPSVRIVDGAVEAVITKRHADGATSDGTPILEFESELVEGFDRDDFMDFAEIPDEMGLVLLRTPDQTPFADLDTPVPE